MIYDQNDRCILMSLHAYPCNKKKSEFPIDTNNIAHTVFSHVYSYLNVNIYLGNSKISMEFSCCKRLIPK